ncbi:MAG: energy-coupling factor ABC transporter permease [Verrucomicrobia bacterium]|nr:energy-coupling factor ABC transporter permease [Verrucomicrobiota bacterium]
MHMADALISPAVGGTMWVVSAGMIAHASRRLRKTLDESHIPLMGVMGAFIFAAQMINFTIPGTGSSGHLGGGLLLAILLGPDAAFLAIASVLFVQALFFADGGLLALGCNIFNLGLFPCYLAYPLVYRPLAGKNTGARQVWTASVVAAVLGLQAGALGVVFETVMSGISELSFKAFASLMLPIHLAIGVVEGMVTATVVSVVRHAHPEILRHGSGERLAGSSYRRVLAGLLIAAALTGGALAWFASAHPDGLEWAVSGITGREEIEAPKGGVHAELAAVQENVAILPDYGFATANSDGEAKTEEAAWPAVSAGTTVSGIVGGVLTLIVIALSGWVVKRRSETRKVAAG